MAHPPDLAEFRDLLARAGFDEKNLVVEPNGTVFAAVPEPSDPALDELRIFVGDQVPELKLHHSIGRGGMGQIRLAQQLALQREVAVKCAVPGSTDRHVAAASLLREARITGALEHPNIVPVHALGKTADGSVLMVMKRIEGTSWARLLQGRASPADELERHIEILMDVCRAVHFAHTRGVLHRDLKPMNVMVGPFGEVYALDWGLAVPLGEPNTGDRPSAVDTSGVVGTPAYMAPEMTVPGSTLDARTDTYLLGGALYEVVTGTPPHQAQTMSERMHQAYLSAPKSFADDVPEELAAICNKALAHDPVDRYASADELRLALAAFLSHASARALCAEAGEQLAELEKLVDDKRYDDVVAARAFSAGRFGFLHALRTWTESREARDGLRALHVAMARHEVARGHADAAAVLLEEIDAPPADLAEGVAALRAAVARDADEKQQLRRIVDELDPQRGQRRRGVLLGALALGWALSAVGLGMARRAGIIAISYLDIILAHLALVAAFSVAFAALRKRVELTKVGRHLVVTAVTIPVITVFMWIGMWVTHSPIALGLAYAHLIIGWGTLLAATYIDKRAIPTALIAFSGFPLILVFREYAFEINGVVVAATGAHLAWIWRR